MKTACCFLTTLALCAAADPPYPQCKPGTFSCFVSINGARYAAACDAYAGPSTALNGVRSGQTGAGLACSCDNGLSLSAQKFVTASNCPRPVDLSSRAYYTGRVFPPYSTVGTANAEGQIHTPSDSLFFFMRPIAGACIRNFYSAEMRVKRCSVVLDDDVDHATQHIVLSKRSACMGSDLPAGHPVCETLEPQGKARHVLGRRVVCVCG